MAQPAAWGRIGSQQPGLHLTTGGGGLLQRHCLAAAEAILWLPCSERMHSLSGRHIKRCGCLSRCTCAQTPRSTQGGTVEEVTLPTLAWRMRADAGYAVAWMRAGGGDTAGPVVEVEFCSVPEEDVVALIYAVR